MRKSSAALLSGLALIVCGCKEQPQTVYVDLNSLVATVPAQAEFDSPEPPAPIPGDTLTMAARPGRTIVDRAQSRIKTARELIEADRQTALRNLRRRLGILALEDVSREQAQALRDFLPRQTEVINTAYAEISRIFEPYATERGQLTKRIETLDGQTDQIIVSRDPELLRRNDIELARLIQERIELDAQFDSESQEILDRAQVQVQSELNRLQVLFEERRVEALDEAARQAQQQIREATQGFDLDLSESQTVRVPPQPARTVVVPPSRRLPAPPEVDVDGVLESRQDQLRLLEHRLGIWLKINGYQRATDRNSGVDRTKDFRQWISLHRPGA